MELAQLQVVLVTENKVKLANFFTQIFDVGPMQDELGREFFLFGGVKLVIESGKTTKKSNIRLSFSVCDQVDLESFQNKLSFYYFREGLDFDLKVKTKADKSVLEFIDSDHRVWQIEKAHNISKTTSQETSLQL